MGKGLLSVSQKLGSSLLRQASERQISSLRWAPGAAFRNPWKPDLPCPSGFLPHGLVMGRVSCVGSRQHWLQVLWLHTNENKFKRLMTFSQHYPAYLKQRWVSKISQSTLQTRVFIKPRCLQNTFSDHFPLLIVSVLMNQSAHYKNKLMKHFNSCSNFNKENTQHLTYLTTRE